MRACGGALSIGLPFRRMLPALGRRLPAIRLNMRRLAGAVRADQPDDLAALDRGGHAVDGHHAAEGFRDRANFEHAPPLPSESPDPLGALV